MEVSMFVGHIDEIEKKTLNHPLMRAVEKQILIGPKQGWADYVMRLFTLGKDGYAPRHTHPWPHIMYAVEGKGNLFMDGQDFPLRSGSVAYVSADKEHQVSNVGPDKFVFICIVPKEGEA
jgi:quercetin dioxygenase-like cupin family protein